MNMKLLRFELNLHVTMAISDTSLTAASLAPGASISDFNFWTASTTFEGNIFIPEPSIPDVRSGESRAQGTGEKVRARTDTCACVPSPLTILLFICSFCGRLASWIYQHSSFHSLLRSAHASCPCLLPDACRRASYALRSIMQAVSPQSQIG